MYRCSRERPEFSHAGRFALQLLSGDEVPIGDAVAVRGGDRAVLDLHSVDRLSEFGSGEAEQNFPDLG